MNDQPLTLGSQDRLEYTGTASNNSILSTRATDMHILVVEDELKTAAYLKKGLEEEGFNVTLAHDGEEGLAKAIGHSYDLLILDVMLPKKDGWALLQELREKGVKSLALFLTAKDSLDDKVKGLNLGGDAYLAKPFAFAELVAQIRSLLRRIPQKAIEVIQVLDLEISLTRQTATRAGRKLELSATEFSLLSLLALNKGQILSRAMISESVWDIRAESDSNVVDVYIRRLRNKVDDPFEKKLIKTVRGIGYSIGDEN
jgi:two-component system copper resistance phosphate regulon response regulator CusR